MARSVGATHGWQGLLGSGKDGVARRGMAGEAWRFGGLARRRSGLVRRGRCGESRHGRHGMAWRCPAGMVRCVEVRLGLVGQGVAGESRQGAVSHRVAGQVWQVVFRHAGAWLGRQGVIG